MNCLHPVVASAFNSEHSVQGRGLPSTPTLKVTTHEVPYGTFFPFPSTAYRGTGGWAERAIALLLHEGNVVHCEASVLSFLSTYSHPSPPVAPHSGVYLSVRLVLRQSVDVFPTKKKPAA